MVGSGNGAALDSSTGNEKKTEEDPITLGMNSSGGSSDGAVTLASNGSTETPTFNPTQTFDNSVDGSSTTFGSDDSSFGSFANPDNNVKPATKSKKVKKGTVTPKVDVQPTTLKEVAPELKPLANNIEDPFAEELNAVPVPERDKPKLASTEIGSFIKEHAFLFTLCTVGFLFALFIFMRRRNQEDHNLSI